jgi:hypothetical protein
VSVADLRTRHSAVSGYLLILTNDATPTVHVAMSLHSM